MSIDNKIKKIEAGSVTGCSISQPFGGAASGGDFSGIIELSNGCIFVYVGDVWGHGAEFAHQSYLYDLTVRYLAEKSLSPSEIADGLNQVICLIDDTKNNRNEPIIKKKEEIRNYDIREIYKELIINNLPDEEKLSYATAFFGIYDPENNTMDFTSTGHPSQIYIPDKDDPERLVELPNRGFFLGFENNNQFKEHKIEIETSNNLFLLYTDGITERRRDKEMYGIERLRKKLKGNIYKNGEEIVRTIFKDVYNFGAEPLDDDTTLLVLNLIPNSKKIYHN